MTTLPSPCLTKPKKINEAEWKRLQELHLLEAAARQNGFSIIAGIDEAGRGPLAGPVVAAACIIPAGIYFPGVNDSKLLSPKKRAELFKQITTESSVTYAIGIICHQEIDRINIFQASVQAMLQAISKLTTEPDYLLVDGLKLNHPTIQSQKVIKGDSLSHSIAAASIIAKETRDRLMEEWDLKFPEYGFKQHKGYGTAAHLQALKQHGACEIHRKTFAPVKETITLNN